MFIYIQHGLTIGSSESILYLQLCVHVSLEMTAFKKLFLGVYYMGVLS